MQIGDAMFGGELLRFRVIDCMPPGKRGMLSLYLGMIEHELTKTKIREQHPEWSEKRVMIEYWRMAFLPDPLPKGFQQQFMEECEEFRPEATTE